MMIGKVAVRLLAALIAIAIPLLFTRRFSKAGIKTDESWKVFWTGCLSFIISQVFHIPFNAAVLQVWGLKSSIPGGTTLVALSIFLGFSAGVFEETTRYFVYKYYLTSKSCRTFESALWFGLGHGGIESILIVGIGGIAQLVGMIVLYGKDLMEMGIPSDQVDAAKEQIDKYWSLPWYDVLLGDLERVFTIIIHIAMTLLVLQCFGQQTTSLQSPEQREQGCARSSSNDIRICWLFLAIVYHAGLDFFAVFLSQSVNVHVAECFVAAWSFISVGIILYFSHRATMSGTCSQRKNNFDTSFTDERRNPSGFIQGGNEEHTMLLSSEKSEGDISNPLTCLSQKARPE